MFLEFPKCLSARLERSFELPTAQCSNGVLLSKITFISSLKACRLWALGFSVYSLIRTREHGRDGAVVSIPVLGVAANPETKPQPTTPTANHKPRTLHSKATPKQPKPDATPQPRKQIAQRPACDATAAPNDFRPEIGPFEGAQGSGCLPCGLGFRVSGWGLGFRV